MIELPFKSPEGLKVDVVSKSILVSYRGSHSHGTYLPPEDPSAIDDKDIMGVFIAPRSYYLGLDQIEGHEWWDGDYDIVFYELKKYLRLLIKSNPNVLSLLWTDSDLFLHQTYLGKELILNRSLFLSKQVYQSFCGYARGQLHRMTNFINPYQGYMGAKRKALVDKYGFDVKNGAHLIRLLRMGIEILRDGEVNVFRKDAQELIDIKQGRWPLREVLDEANRLFPIMETAYKNSALPENPDTGKITSLCVDMLSYAFKGPGDELYL